MTSSKIELREPPPRIATGHRPIMPLDQSILQAAATVSMRPVQIADILRDNGWDGLTTQRVAQRLKSLVNRNLAVRIKPVGGPPNGPGTSLYRARRPEDDQTDG